MFILQCFQAGGASGRHLYSRSEILATDEWSRAAHISRVVQTSQQAAQATGGEADCVCEYMILCQLHVLYVTVLFLSSAADFEPEENLHSSEGQSHMYVYTIIITSAA